MIPSPPKRVIIGLPVLLIGGTEVHTLVLSQSLISAGYEVIVCCYYEYDARVVGEFRSCGVDVLLLGLTRKRLKQNSAELAQLLWVLVRTFRHLQPDIVHIHYLAPGFIPIVAARIAGVKTIFSTIHIAGRNVYSFKHKVLFRTAMMMCSVCICVSRDVEAFWFGSRASFWKTDSQVRRRTIPNCVDIHRITTHFENAKKNELRNEIGVKNEKIIGVVGRLAHQKGQDFLLHALAGVIKQNGNIILLIVGEGSTRKELEVLAQQFSVEKHIRWLGNLPQDKVFELFAIMDLFVMPSRYEGFGLSIVEAMAAGLPVIATNVEGLREIVENGRSGLIVEFGDVDSLSRAMTNLLEDQVFASTLGKEGKKVAIARFSRERFDEAIRSLYYSWTHHG